MEICRNGDKQAMEIHTVEGRGVQSGSSKFIQLSSNLVVIVVDLAPLRSA